MAHLDHTRSWLLAGAGTGKVAFRIFKWMIGFSVVAAVLAYVLSMVIQPGMGMVFSGELDSSLQVSADKALGWQDTLLNFVSTNIWQRRQRHHLGGLVLAGHTPDGRLCCIGVTNYVSPGPKGNVVLRWDGISRDYPVSFTWEPR